MITGGHNYISSAPAFSNDAKKLLVCTGNTVSIFSTDTGMLVTELEGHTDRVTSIIVVPVAEKARKFVHYCWTSSLDGTICHWDFSAPELMKKVLVQLPVHSMVIPHISRLSTDSSGKIFNLHAFVSVEDINKPVDELKALRGQILMFNLTNSRRIGSLLSESRKPKVISMSKSGEFIGIMNKQKLLIWRIPTKNFKFDEVRKIKLHHTRRLSALAFHPTDRIVAGGDVTGRILIWRDFGKRSLSEKAMKLGTKDEDDRPGVRGRDDADSCTTWHWHPSELQILFFSSDGAYLYSGGKEGVLVVWQLDTGKKKFKPRLGSPLLYYTHSPDPSLSCVSCADNQIQLLKMPSMELIKTIAGVKPPFLFPDTFEKPSGGFVFDQSAGLVSLQTSDYCVQFFSLFENFEVSQVRVCERNFQPVEDVTVFIALIALSTDGSMMGTVDVRLPEEGLGHLVTLKFWVRGMQPGNYNLSTVIYEPHSDAEVSSLTFRPGHGMGVSTSCGGEFKVWVYYSNIHQKDQVQKSGWRCQSVGSYKKLPMAAAAFSADGSILAVAAERIITLWDPDKNALITVMGDTLTPITTISFIGRSEYLVTVSQGSIPQLAVWDLSKLSTFWSYKLYAEAVSCKEDGSQFAVLVLPNSPNATATDDQDGIILLFDAQNPVPHSIWMVKKAKGAGLAFLSPDVSNHHIHMETVDGSDASMLVYINCNHEFIVFDPKNCQETKIKRKTNKIHLPADETGSVGYASIYGELPEFDVQKEKIPKIPYAPSGRPWDIFSESSHDIPLTKLCSDFFSFLLERKS